MSWSLELRNGDLTTAGARLGTVQDHNKLRQDLRCALLERMGTDDMHRLYGSLIDGGYQNGRWIPSLVGTTDWTLAAMRVEGEIRRICAQHQEVQLARAQEDRRIYGESTLNPQELLLEVEDLEMFQSQDAMLVRVTIATGSTQTVILDVPVGTRDI